MKDPNLTREPLEITDEARVSFLRDRSKMQYLDAFMTQERSLKEAAAYMRVRLNVMSYWVKKLLELGLIKETRREARRGRPIKYYRATRDAFIVPLSVVADDQYLEILNEAFEPYWRNFMESMARGVARDAEHLQLRYFSMGKASASSIEERKHVVQMNSPTTDNDDGMNIWATFRFTDEQLKRFSRAMFQLYLDMKKESEGDNLKEEKKYLIHLGLTDV